MTDQNYTHLALVVDRSGSMRRIMDDMEGAIHSLLETQGKEPGELRVDVTLFDDQIETPYEDRRADDIKGQLIMPRGNTALNDALGSTIVRLGEKFAKMAEDDRPGTVILAVVTDGRENASREYTADQVKALVETQKAEWDWQFRFLGTGIDSFAVAGGYGIRQGETISFAASGAGIDAVMASTSKGFSATRSGLRGAAAEYGEADRDAAMKTE